MPFGVVSGVRLGMGVLDFGGDLRRGRGSLGGEFAVSHYNLSLIHISEPTRPY